MLVLLQSVDLQKKKNQLKVKVKKSQKKKKPETNLFPAVAKLEKGVILINSRMNPDPTTEHRKYLLSSLTEEKDEDEKEDLEEEEEGGGGEIEELYRFFPSV